MNIYIMYANLHASGRNVLLNSFALVIMLIDECFHHIIIFACILIITK